MYNYHIFEVGEGSVMAGMHPMMPSWEEKHWDTHLFSCIIIYLCTRNSDDKTITDRLPGVLLEGAWVCIQVLSSSATQVQRLGKTWSFPGKKCSGLTMDVRNCWNNYACWRFRQSPQTEIWGQAAYDPVSNTQTLFPMTNVAPQSFVK